VTIKEEDQKLIPSPMDDLSSISVEEEHFDNNTSNGIVCINERNSLTNTFS
jgi:hypothetical protein